MKYMQCEERWWVTMNSNIISMNLKLNDHAWLYWISNLAQQATPTGTIWTLPFFQHGMKHTNIDIYVKSISNAIQSLHSKQCFECVLCMWKCDAVWENKILELELEPVTSLFLETFVQACIKENTKAARYWPWFPAQKVSSVENVSIW